MAAGGLFLAVTLIASGVLLTWAHTFIGNEVHTQLAAQQIYFPAANSKAVAGPEFAAMRPYGGQQLTTGAQAKAYADHFIANHLKEIGGGKTYAQMPQYLTASGKGTLAKRLAAHYGFKHLDSGLLYRGVGKASAINTCNSWVATRLRLAGIESSLWPPFVQGLVRRYRRTGQST